MTMPLMRALVWVWVALVLAGVLGGTAQAQEGELRDSARATSQGGGVEAELDELERQRVMLVVSLEKCSPEDAKHALTLRKIREIDDAMAQLEGDAGLVPCVFIGPRPALDTDDPAEVYRKQLAEIDLLVRVDRDFAEAEKALSVLRLRAMGPPAYDGQREVVVLATARLAEVQMAQRDFDRAAETLDRILDRRARATLDADEWFTAAAPEWRTKETEWLADARLEGQRKQVAAWREARQRPVPEVAVDSPGPAGPSLDALAEELMRDLAQGDGALLDAMGSSAVPALAHLTRLTIDGIDANTVAKVEGDPLYRLMRIAPDWALGICEETAGTHTPLLWRKRVARGMAEANLLYEGDEVDGRWRLEEPRWNSVLDELVGDPALIEDVAPLLRARSKWSDWTEPQARAVEVVLTSGDPNRVRLLEAGNACPWFLPPHTTNVRRDEDARLDSRQLAVLAAGIADPTPAAKDLAARYLASYGAPFPFLGHLEDASSRARMHFVEASKIAPLSCSEDERAGQWVDALVALLDDESVDVRRHASSVLGSAAWRERVPAERLMTAVDDPDESVRQSLFQRFNVGNEKSVRVSEGEQALLRALLRDSSEQVRLEVLRIESARAQPTWITREELMRLTEDPAPRVRGSLAWIQIGDEALAAEIYARLGADSDDDVVGAAESKVQYMTRNGTELEAMLPYFEARLWNPVHPALSGENHPRGMAFEFLQLPAGMSAAVRFAREHPESEAGSAVTKALDYQRRTTELLTPTIAELPVEDLAFILVETGRKVGTPFKANASQVHDFELSTLMEGLLELDTPSLRSAMAEVARDPSAHRIVRIYAYAWCMRHAAGESAEDFQQFLRSPSLEDALASPLGEQEALRTLSESIDPDVRNEVCRRIVDDREVPGGIAYVVTRGYAESRPGGIQVARAMVRRWLQPGDVEWYGNLALDQLGGVPGEVDPDALRACLKHTALDDRALRALAQLKDPHFLPDLREALNPTWIGYKEERHNFAKAAAYTISQYMTDQAAEVLLEGVGVAETEEIRQACFDGLERIRLYQEARERLNRRDVGKAKRDEAVRELVAMLDEGDAATVAAAAKGLAALGAVDELPTLIRLMKHSDAGVRAAATEAVARLTDGEADDESSPR